MLAVVKIKTIVYSAEYGALSAGDVLRCSQEFAQHLVDQGAATYLDAPPPAPPAAVAPEAPLSQSPRRRARAKE
jgi:hypothetical protein